MDKDDWTGLVVGLVVLVLVVFGLYSCSDNPSTPGQKRTSNSGVNYYYFEVEGMPCIYVTEGLADNATGGPSCDWSKWEGRGK
jgi:hypothetical protein